MASGADLQFIASIYNRMQYRIVAAPGIDRVEQLKGKVVGIARIHDVSHFYMRLALKKLGMNPDQDVRVISTGGQADRTLALKNGRVAATILNPAFAMTLEKDGFKTILDIETLNFPVVGNMTAVRRAFLKDRRSLAVRFVRALVASMKKIQDDPEFSKKVLAKNLRLQDKAIIDENYRFNSGKFLETVSDPAARRFTLRHRFAGADGAGGEESEGRSADRSEHPRRSGEGTPVDWSGFLPRRHEGHEGFGRMILASTLRALRAFVVRDLASYFSERAS